MSSRSNGISGLWTSARLLRNNIEFRNSHDPSHTLRSVAGATGSRSTASGATLGPRYYIGNLEARATRLLKWVRSHWSVEKPVPWNLDVTFLGDQLRVRRHHGRRNVATLRQTSHNLLKRETALKVGIHGKRLQVGW